MKVKIGLALGGGGARGLAHLGVLKVFEREGIVLHQITGCSIGAIIGGAYAYTQNAREAEQIIRDILDSPAVKELDLQSFANEEKDKSAWNMSYYINNLKNYFSLFKTLGKRSMFDQKQVEAIFESYPDIAIEQLPLRFSCIATDLISGREIVLQEGNLRQAITASASIPGVFPPVQIDNLLLIDGAATDSIPVQIVKGQGAQYVFAVDVTKCVEDVDELDNALKIMYRAEDIVTYHLTQERLAGADLVIRPKVRHFSWAAVKHMDAIIKAGEQAAEEAMPQIKRILGN